MKRQQRIEQTLQSLNPSHLEVSNESFMHHVPEGSETHFKIIMVSLSFEGLNRVARHRLINQKLQTELAQGLHALTMHLFTPNEWEQRQQPIQQSPKCHNGRRHD